MKEKRCGGEGQHPSLCDSSRHFNLKALEFKAIDRTLRSNVAMPILCQPGFMLFLFVTRSIQKRPAAYSAQIFYQLFGFILFPQNWWSYSWSTTTTHPSLPLAECKFEVMVFRWHDTLFSHHACNKKSSRWSFTIVRMCTYTLTSTRRVPFWIAWQVVIILTSLGMLYPRIVQSSWRTRDMVGIVLQSL